MSGTTSIFVQVINDGEFAPLEMIERRQKGLQDFVRRGDRPSEGFVAENFSD